jgi:hypothetical protein
MQEVNFPGDFSISLWLKPFTARRSKMDEPNDMHNRWLAASAFEKAFELTKWAAKIPFIKFPPDWEIQMTPPFTGAVVRFRVKVPGCDGEVSIYLDCYDQLGYWGAPYWEVYPHLGDVGRCAMNDVKTLLDMIADRREREDS